MVKKLAWPPCRVCSAEKKKKIFPVTEFILPFSLKTTIITEMFSFFRAILVYFILDFHKDIDPYSSLLENSQKSPVT